MSGSGWQRWRGRGEEADAGRVGRRPLGVAAAGVVSLLAMSSAIGVGPAGAEPVGVAVPMSRGGSITVWGDDDDFEAVRHPPRALTGKTVVAIDASPAMFSIALTSDSEVFVWGDGDTGGDEIPSALAGQTVTAIAAGRFHCLALASTGRVYGWGSDSSGQSIVPASLTGRTVTAIAGGRFHSLALTSDGAVTAWGSNEYGQATVPASLTGKRVTMISAGDDYSLAVTDDGAVTAWGDNDFGQTTVPASLAGKTVTQVDAGGDHSLAVTSDGRVTAWGLNWNRQSTVPAAVSRERVVAVAAGSNNSMVLSSGGVVQAWGANDSGQSTVPAALTGKNVTSIATGFLHSMALVGPSRPAAQPALAAPSTPRVASSKAGRVFTHRTQRRLLLSGRGRPGASVTVRDGSARAGSTTVDDHGTWRLTSGPFRVGRHVLIATQSEGGRTSPSSPRTPIMMEHLAVTIAKKLTTRASRPRIKGRGNRGDVVVVRTSTGRFLGRARVRTDGIWRLRTRTLRDGVHKIRATQTIAGTTTRSTRRTIRIN